MIQIIFDRDNYGWYSREKHSDGHEEDTAIDTSWGEDQSIDDGTIRAWAMRYYCDPGGMTDAELQELRDTIEIRRGQDTVEAALADEETLLAEEEAAGWPAPDCRFRVKRTYEHSDGCKERAIVARGFAPDQNEASFRFAARGAEMRTFGGQVTEAECTCSEAAKAAQMRKDARA